MESIKKFINDYKKSFLIIMFLGILIHLFAITNKLLNWDEINCLFSKGGTIDLGRWGLEVIQYIFPNLSIPTYNGIIAILFISVSSLLICDILEINKKINQVIVGLILLSFPSFTCTMSYMFTVHCYMFSFLLAVLTVYFARKNGKVNFVISIILLVCSLSIYQAYLSITATLMIIVLLKNNLKNEIELKKQFLNAVKFLGILAISLIFYIIITNIILKINNTSLSEYQGLSNLSKNIFYNVINGVIMTYKYTLGPIVSTSAITPSILMRIIYLVILLFDILFIGFKIFKNSNSKKSILLNILFVLVIPISMNIIWLTSNEVSYHALMMYGICFVYIFAIMCTEYIDKKILKNFILVFISLQIIFYITLANEAYLKLYLSYENTYSFYQGVVSSIKNTEGFNENTKIVIVGKYNYKQGEEFKKFYYLSNYTGITSTYDLINAYSKINFIKWYVGFDGEFVSQDKVKDILKENEKFKNMPQYPYYGSVEKIEDLIVVKLSDYE